MPTKACAFLGDCAGRYRLAYYIAVPRRTQASARNEGQSRVSENRAFSNSDEAKITQGRGRTVGMVEEVERGGCRCAWDVEIADR